MSKITEEQRLALKDFIAKKEWSKLINVSELIMALNSKGNTFSKILDENANSPNCYKNPGCYKWWAKEDDVKDLLCKITDKKIDFDQIKKMKIFEYRNIAKEVFYCIYVGKADNIYKRLRKHTKSLYQSTVRRTIYSLKCKEEKSLDEINKSINKELKKFKVQYFSVDNYYTDEKIRRDGKKQKNIILANLKTKCTLLDLEYYFINEFFHILNVEENDYAEYNKLDENDYCFGKTKEIGNDLENKKLSTEKIKEKIVKNT